MTQPITADGKGRARLLSLLGDLPDPALPIRAVQVAEDDYDLFTLETLSLELNGLEPVAAYFTRPKHAAPPCPAVLFSHSHGGFYHMGKNELLTPAPYGYREPYARALAARGVACLAIDHWCFGERAGRGESAAFKSMLWKGQVLWGMMVYDSLRALDYLTTRPDVDENRIGALGMSMGSTMSIWVSALDPRVKVTADLCCLTDFEELENEKGLDLHGIFYYVPSLTKYFSMADINALIAPRPHLSTAGVYDGLTPLKGLRKIEQALAPLGGFTLKTYPCGHLETRLMREDVLAFISARL